MMEKKCLTNCYGDNYSAHSMPKTARTYATIQAWMEATGTTMHQLADLADIEYTCMSRLLTRSRRCSLEKAWRLHQITGVPVENLVRWQSAAKRATLEQSFKSDPTKVA